MHFHSRVVFICITLEALVCQLSLLAFEETSVKWASNFSATFWGNVNALILLLRLLFCYGKLSVSEKPVKVFHFVIFKTRWLSGYFSFQVLESS